MWTVADALYANFDNVSDHVEVDGQFINVLNPDQAVATVRSRLLSGFGFTFATLNLDHLVKRRADPAFRAAYARATLVSADGAPIVALGRAQAPSLRRVTGADLLRPLCAMAEREGLPVAFFGSSQPALDGAAARLRAEFPELRIVFAESPAFGFDPFSDAAAEAGARIVASGAKLVFLCLGAPKQELFADRLAQIYAGVGFIGVGAAVDFIVGAQKRAPRAMRRLGLEWLWRAASNPRRLAGRYAKCALLLARIVIEQRLLAVTAPRGVARAGVSPAR
ncbi:polymer biosynthesis protein, WecB/TagA/CpsF family [Rhodoblastus acidophilus]|uniref:Polymer biosynthesis protein, WecB/TagA/CpsF family n=1 Tax=Rhodoblastus acidophilus TaxID=1074 RepID=A0A212QKH6_RHOAC|nr:WecB/TagA/CpsF family glycosyltransferase [Rhodoblastus acidophilus]PPQ39900.1 glycosyltransferase [Rhodoblastus acidophilus]RAI18468.1 glycosyltransferase [Rhodoblastus acidophilus]SNB59890.1 polymer biosynthesis protein, WecB/TagA/CpsF family [Rhodoblastus acidophilus]